MFKKTLLVAISASLLSLASLSTLPAYAKEVSNKEVIENYATIALAGFSDSLNSAKKLKLEIDAFVANPSEASFKAAKQAWLAARVPYGQTEVFRFGNPNVDEWEGQVNAWPLDEGLIDYVASNYEHEDGNQFAAANIVSGKEKIDAALLKSFHEKGGSEANVATGYHAIEFLLWGQDLNKDPKSAGTRSYTDYAKGKDCTNGNCDRRAEYLTAAAQLLVTDLQDMVADWQADKDNYRATFMKLSEKEALRRMLFGMGSLSLGELAGERINVALLAHSQEDEHSCFSDNTHTDIAENARGINNVFNGRYSRIDGTTIKGASLAQLVEAKDKKLSDSLKTKLTTTENKINAIVKAANSGEHFDQQIKSENKAGNARIQAVIESLRNQTVDIEATAKVLGISNLNSETSESFSQN
ncbi:peptidase [Cocleimonas sp. KMM 6892]|jgi:putative iron-regulated protein|uniref:imelysin family protein n=1 Tax=unclassified Cocleimonas TaxID=2639732 RepID=UPI002DBA8D63|nr:MULTISPECIES: imelysin family protein [unclassified Cocleimonas]MEB8432736.1 peptidase [Cocleimonas sp. KMM 6892]MEC4715595.1 peptidase [Cocleimonas sp. KMM 6895]MEC4744787.1 peptidase [Cocleimonas sp. KMM 6896]